MNNAENQFIVFIRKNDRKIMKKICKTSKKAHKYGKKLEKKEKYRYYQVKEVNIDKMWNTKLY